MKHEGEKKGGGLVGSALTLAACYFVLCLVCFLMIVINDPANWTGYFLENYTDLITTLRTGRSSHRRTTSCSSFRSLSSALP